MSPDVQALEHSAPKTEEAFRLRSSPDAMPEAVIAVKVNEKSTPAVETAESPAELMSDDGGSETIHEIMKWEMIHLAAKASSS